jgi:hypothetical protein
MRANSVSWRITKSWLSDHNLTELVTRLQVHFEEADHELNFFDKDHAPHPLPYALLAAIDLVEEIQRHMARDDVDIGTADRVGSHGGPAAVGDLRTPDAGRGGLTNFPLKIRFGRR